MSEDYRHNAPRDTHFFFSEGESPKAFLSELHGPSDDCSDRSRRHAPAQRPDLRG